MKKILFSIIILSISLTSFAQMYEVGHVYEINGVKGLVYKVSPNQRHGMMISIDCVPAKSAVFCTDKVSFDTVICQSDNGKENFAAIEKYITDNNLSWDNFPVFQWIKENGKGWYLPSIKELQEVYEVLYETSFVNNRIKGQDKKIKPINKEINDNGGTPFGKKMISSTECKITNKKNKSKYYVYCIYKDIEGSSNVGGLIGFISDVTTYALNDTYCKIISSVTTKASGTRLIMEF